MQICGNPFFNCMLRSRYSIRKYVLKTFEDYWEVSNWLVAK